MKRKLIYLFIAFAAAILPAHAQKFRKSNQIFYK